MTIKYENPANDLILNRTVEMFDNGIDECVGVEGAELHYALFNEEEAFCYASDAEDALTSVGTWSAIRLVSKYEHDYFGQLESDIDPCKIANMCVYIYGEFLLHQSEHLDKKWDKPLNKTDIKKIKKEIQNFFNEGVSYRNFDGMVWDEYGAY